MKKSNNRCDKEIKKLLDGHTKKCDCSRPCFNISGKIVNAFFNLHDHFDHKKVYKVCHNIYHTKFKEFVVSDDWKNEERRLKRESSRIDRENLVPSRKSARLHADVHQCIEIVRTSNVPVIRRSDRLAGVKPLFVGNSNDDDDDLRLEKL